MCTVHLLYMLYTHCVYWYPEMCIPRWLYFSSALNKETSDYLKYKPEEIFLFSYTIPLVSQFGLEVPTYVRKCKHITKSKVCACYIMAIANNFTVQPDLYSTLAG